MRIFEIALPLNDNSGKDMSGAHAAFQTIICQKFGGYTARPTGEGAWYSEKDGRVHYDQMKPYQVAANMGEWANSESVRNYLLDLASRLFPDQQAFFIADVGTAEIFSRLNVTRQPDKAQGSGRTDRAFEVSASLGASYGGKKPPAQSSTRVPPADEQPGRLVPFEYFVAKIVLQSKEIERTKLSNGTWALSEALRAYDAGGPIEPVVDALIALGDKRVG